MNDEFRQLKGRIRRLETILMERGLTDANFAQALSKLRRAEKRGDRSREPSLELRTLLERAEGLVPGLA